MAERKNKPANSSTGREDEDYKEAAKSTADYADYQPPQKEPNPIWRKLGIGLAILGVTIVLIAGGYWLAKNHKSSSKPSALSEPTQANTPASGSKIAKATKHYDSTNFSLGFDYPADWRVSDTGNGQLTVKSPAVTVKDSSGQTVDATISLTIRKNDQKLPEFDGGNAIAAMDSEKVAYTNPTQTQRANTYLSFLSYANSNHGMNGIYITGDNGYKKAQAIPKADIQKSDPIISVTFTKAGTTTSLSVSADNWKDSDFSEPLKSMLQSLAIT